MRSVNTRFECRAQFIGVLRRSCPYCGHVQDHEIRPATWRVRCVNKACNREMGLGLIFYRLDNPRKAQRVRPPDTVLPVEPMERAPVADYTNGDPVHQLRSHADAPDYVLCSGD